MVVANLRQFDDCEKQVGERVIHCRSIAWGELAKRPRSEEALEVDFFDSLGDLGIRAFALRNLKMKNIQIHLVHRGKASAAQTDEQWFLKVLEKLGDGRRSY